MSGEYYGELKRCKLCGARFAKRKTESVSSYAKRLLCGRRCAGRIGSKELKQRNRNHG